MLDYPILVSKMKLFILDEADDNFNYSKSYRYLTRRMYSMMPQETKKIFFTSDDYGVEKAKLETILEIN